MGTILERVTDALLKVVMDGSMSTSWETELEDAEFDRLCREVHPDYAVFNYLVFKCESPPDKLVYNCEFGTVTFYRKKRAP